MDNFDLRKYLAENKLFKESVNPGGLEVGFFEVIKDFSISPGGGWRINFKKGEYLRSNINGLQRLVGPNKFKDVRPPISGTDNLDITLYGTHFDQNRMREEFDNNTKEIQKFGKIISTGGSIEEGDIPGKIGKIESIINDLGEEDLEAIIKYMKEKGRLEEVDSESVNEGFTKLSDEQKAKVKDGVKKGLSPEDVIDQYFDYDDKYLQSVKTLMDNIQ